MPPSSKAKPPAAPPPAADRNADEDGGGALARARQFAKSRGLPPPEVDGVKAKPAPAKKKKKPAAKETRR